MGGVLTRGGHLDTDGHTRRMSGRDCSGSAINQGSWEGGWGPILSLAPSAGVGPCQGSGFLPAELLDAFLWFEFMVVCYSSSKKLKRCTCFQMRKEAAGSRFPPQVQPSLFPGGPALSKQLGRSRFVLTFPELRKRGGPKAEFGLYVSFFRRGRWVGWGEKKKEPQHLHR